ncbi:MAG TPA: immunoglobulin domain-containing protein, partial [Chitinophagaceae bacterium]
MVYNIKNIDCWTVLFDTVRCLRCGVTRGFFVFIVSLFAIIKVNAQCPANITTQPISQTTGIGCTITFSVVASGDAPLTYQWLFNGNPIGGATTASYNISSVNAGDAGNYSVVVTADACGTPITSNIATLTVNPPLSPGSHNTDFVEACIGYNPAVLTITGTTGGQLPYSYQWYENSNPVGTNSASYNPSGIISPGTHEINCVITDACGTVVSTAIKTINIVNDPIITASGDGAFCLGVPITLTGNIAGGTGVMQYQWQSGISSSGPWSNIPGATASTYSPSLSAGIYYYQVTLSPNVASCNNSSSTVTVIVNSLPTVTLSSQTHILCYGTSTGAIDIIPSGGSGSYTYAWTGTGVNPAAQDQTGLTAGNYSVIVTDANNCSSTALSITLTQPASAVAVALTSQTNILCFGQSTGAIDITPSGGVGPYTYAWTGTGVNATAQDQTGLAAGSYSVIVTDANGCSASPLNVTLTQPVAALALSETHVDVLCFGNSTGSIDLAVTGGTSPYTYAWSNGATTQDITSLLAGTYNVTVTDANGCTTVLNNIVITQPAAALALSETHVNVLCFGNSTGSINLTVTGGTSPYTYAWSNGATTQDITSLPAGTYNVTVTDANGCTAVLNNIVITQPAAALALSETNVNVLCFGNSTGSIDLTVAGGTSPYTYAWSNGATTQDITSLPAGTYSVTVTDANGCTAVLNNIVITQPAAALALSETHVNVLCFGNSTGSINLTVTGGTSPYTYAWSNGATTQDITSLPAGAYNVTVTDANGCTAVLNNIVITQPAAALALSETHVNVL